MYLCSNGPLHASCVGLYPVALRVSVAVPTPIALAVILPIPFLVILVFVRIVDFVAVLVIVVRFWGGRVKV
jgi:hypothetical protein